MANKMLKNKKGFSLIELIVVIAILGVIAVIAVPAVMSTLSKSKIDADVQSAIAIARAVKTDYVALNADATATNDQAAIADTALADLDAALTSVQKEKTPSSNAAGAFTVTVTLDTDKTPHVTVKFTEGSNNHSVSGDSGVDTITAAS